MEGREGRGLGGVCRGRVQDFVWPANFHFLLRETI